MGKKLSFDRSQLDEFIRNTMRKSDRYVPARQQSALALLERLREYPSLSLDEHKSGGSSGLISHETYGDKAHQRLGIDLLNKNHGRRSSDLGSWGQALLNLIAADQFSSLNEVQSSELIALYQAAFGEALLEILEQDPLIVKVKGRTAESVIKDVLRQAESKGKSGEVAQYLVGAKLMLRLNREIAIHPYNKGDRKSHRDSTARAGDFEIENAVIEVALGVPDKKHLAQIEEALDDRSLEFWLLTRHDRVASWLVEIADWNEVDKSRLVIGSVEAFIGQNITELGGFSNSAKQKTLSDLFDLYNQRWDANLGTKAIRIEIK